MNLHPQSDIAYKLLHDGTLALARAERQGIHINLEYVQKKKIQLTNKIEYLEESFRETKFFRDWQKTSTSQININSKPQLGKYLYDVLHMDVSKETATGKGSTDDEALKQMGIPELEYLLKIGKLKKIRDTYLEGFAKEQVDGIIHPFFNLHLVTTYRSSSDSPNFQNIPKRDKEAMKICRGALMARPGHQLVEFDYTGAEVRIAACYHKDPTMLNYIKDPTTDMHGDVAQQLFKVSNFDASLPEHYLLRQAAKNGFVFPQFYGDYYKNCAKNIAVKWCQLPETKFKSGMGVSMPGGIHLSDHLISQGIRSFDSFTNLIREVEYDFWTNRFFMYAEWKEKMWNAYQKSGYIDFFTGFRISGVFRKNEATNYPIQGSAFHCLLWSLIKLDQYIIKHKLDSRIIGQIHDSIVLDANPDELSHIEDVVTKIICEDLPNTWPWIIVPLKIDIEKYKIDGSWADKLK